MNYMENWILTHPDTKPDMCKIEITVCKELGITRKMLRSKTREVPVPMARFLCMDFARQLKIFPTISKLGNHFNKNHATVCHASTQVKNAVETDRIFRNSYNKIKIELKY